MFAENESVSCQSITVPQSDAELRLEIVVPSPPLFQLGPRSIATITIDGPVTPTDEDTSADNTEDTTAVDPSTEETTEEEEGEEEEEEEEGDGSGDDNKQLEVEVDIDRVGDG